ncbi:hypothetical protein NDU88_006514 [Pleurodeles waltl]|uniref:Uncharacterized protein n=1 Tax=Pleurodeles waltl TaxID=8319 RepID=A0AAV7LQX6_PLEWA|nr:hypothetical protein NDU88_006514 [Pleurodeles waltl]
MQIDGDFPLVEVSRFFSRAGPVGTGLRSIAASVTFAAAGSHSVCTFVDARHLLRSSPLNAAVPRPVPTPSRCCCAGETLMRTGLRPTPAAPSLGAPSPRAVFVACPAARSRLESVGHLIRSVSLRVAGVTNFIILFVRSGDQILVWFTGEESGDISL